MTLGLPTKNGRRMTMNKQQLASTIWQSANQMRSKIEANEYKDYILGFMFYKYLSEREIQFLKDEGYKDVDIKKSVRRMFNWQSTFARILDILSHIIICSLHGLRRAMILISPMFVML